MIGTEQYVDITYKELQQSAAKHKKELMLLPVLSMESIKPFFKFNFGIRFTETRSMLKGKAKFGPYNTKKSNKLSLDLGTEVLETKLGNCVETFDPNSLVETIWGEDVVQGEALKRGDMAKKILALLQKGVGEDLRDAIFLAERDDDGSDAMALYDGFIKKTAQAITASKISKDKGNYAELPEITALNALDVLKEFYRSADKKLKNQKTNMYVPTHVLEKLQDDYAVTRAANSYNTTFNQVILEGSMNKCTIVAMDMMPDNEFIYLSIKDNMNINFNLSGAKEEVMEVDRFSAFELTYSLATFFGVGFSTFEKEFLKVGKLNAKVEGGGE